jgi:hypothetical protein
MNWSEIESEWEPMKALLVSHWHMLSDDDLARIDGKREVLAHVLQERLGLDAAAAEAALRVPPRLLWKYALRGLPLVLPVKQVRLLSEPDFKPLA